MLLMMDLCGEDDASDDSSKAERWTSMIDRGGLFHVSDSTYTLFHAMEEEVRDQLRKTPAHKITCGFKEKLLSSILLRMKMSFSTGVCCRQMQIKRMPRPY